MHRDAAVALIRLRAPDPEYLILRRAFHPQDPWSGHFALPGGRRDPEDADLYATCLRETLEEVGLALPPASLIKILPECIAGRQEGTAVRVQPYLFELTERPTLSPDPIEIASAHWVPESFLVNPASHTRVATLPQLPDRLFPALPLEDYFIWGFTYALLGDLLGWDHTV